MIKEAYGNPKVTVLNAKTEYSRCVLPGVSIQATEEDKKEDERMKAIILGIRKGRGLPEKEKEEEKELHCDLDPEEKLREDSAASKIGVLGSGGRPLPSRAPEEGLSCYPHGPDDQVATSSGHSTSQSL